MLNVNFFVKFSAPGDLLLFTEIFMFY